MSIGAFLVSIGLLLANGFFVGAEFALIAARRSRMEQLAAGGSRRASLAVKSMRDLNFVLAGAQLGITMASLGLGFVAEPALTRTFEDLLEPVGIPSGLGHGLALGVALLVVVSAHMVLSEMVPKNIAIAEPEPSALLVAAPFRWYLSMFRPVIWFLNLLANGTLRLFGFQPQDELAASRSADELAAMVEASRTSGAIEELEHRLLTKALGLTRLDAAAIMTPRPDVVAMPSTSAVGEVERRMAVTGHSRLPVFVRDLDDVVGFVHAKDLLRLPASQAEDAVPSEVVREFLVVPESRTLVALHSDMRRMRRHFGIVVDEHGGTAGIVTLEDVLEELVGEIRDEYDPREGRVWRLGPRRHLADAGLRLDELEAALGVDLPEGDYDTLAGFLMARLGRVPEVGDQMEHDGWVLRVRRMAGRRVERVELVGPRPREGRGD